MNICQKSQSNRVLWIDVMKGLLIILMVLGHCGGPMVKIIYTFHMPAFLFLSGFTAHPEKYRFHSFLKNKTMTLLFPYILWNVIFIVFYRILLNAGIYILFDPSWNITIFDFFANLITTDLGGATWFLLVLFNASMLYYMLQTVFHLLKAEAFAPFFALLLGCCGHYLGDNGHYLRYMMDSSLYALFYYGLGKLFSQRNLFDKIPEKPMLIISAVSTVVFGVMYPNLLMNWPLRQYTGILEEAIGSISGIYICYQISRFLCVNDSCVNLLGTFGKNSLIILIFHFLSFRIVFSLFVILGINSLEILKSLTPPNGWNLQWLVVWIFSLGVCWGLIKFANLNRISRFIFKGEISK